jgi:hypothetical protein
MPQIIVTIDTEVSEFGGMYTNSAFETHIEGKVSGQEVGYRFIIGLLNKYGIRGEFFIDIYSYKKFGEPLFNRLSNEIHRGGHNVQLHTHPSLAFDSERPFLHQYTLNEQIEIVKFGMEKLRQWIGSYPLAHRAGLYGIDRNTFGALSHAGVRVDCSYYYRHQNCKFQCDAINEPFELDGIIELPVTVYKKVSLCRNPIGIARRLIEGKPFSKDVFLNEKYQKLDIAEGASLNEIKKVIKRRRKDSVVVLFLHSSSFLKKKINFRERRYESIIVDKELINIFEELLNWISTRSECKVKTIDTVDL